MSKGGAGIKRAQARKRATLVGIDQANRPGQGGEAIGNDAFQDLGDSFQKDDDPEGSRRGVVIFAWFGKYNAVGTFQSGGVVSMGEEGA